MDLLLCLLLEVLKEVGIKQSRICSITRVTASLGKEGAVTKEKTLWVLSKVPEGGAHK